MHYRWRVSMLPLLFLTPFLAALKASNLLNPPTLHPRSIIPSESLIKVSNASTQHPQANRNSTILDGQRDLCQIRSLQPSLWKSLDMNSYLDGYKNGSTLNLEEYSYQVGALDFECGIGRVCNPGQLCESVYGRDWYALVAAQNWNNFINIVYQAVGDAFDIVSDVLPTMLIDFEKDFQRTPRHYAAWSGLISNWISSFPSSLFQAYGPVIESIGMSLGTVSWLGLIMVSYQVNAFSWLETFVIVGERGKTRFKRSSFITWMLSQAQDAVQSIISNITQEVLHAGISSDKGLASINRDGIFLSSTPITDREAVQKEYEKALKLKTLVKIWRLQNVFIARGADPCTQTGPNGAFSNPKLLSYCGEDSIMMSIARAEVKGDGYDPFLYHAPLADKKYGFTTEYLTTASWECQQKYRAFDFDPHELCQNSTVFRNLNELEDCVVNIPVCDCTQPDMIKALQKGYSITKACREINGLPI